MQSALKIRYGRTALAVVGASSLLAAIALTVVALFGAAPALAAVIFFAIALISVAILRALAVRDRRSRVADAFREAMYPSDLSEDQLHSRTATDPAAPTQLFDAEEGQEEQGLQRLSAEELRQAALEVAAAAGDLTPTNAVGATWEPVAVPLPVYVQAPKADRPAPEPLRLPEAPKPEGKPTMMQAASEHRAPTQPAADEARPTTGRINLDAVLQRRRA